MRQTVRRRSETCQDNNLNMSKTKELIMDYRKMRAEHAPIHINGAVHITNKLSWSKHRR